MNPTPGLDVILGWSDIEATIDDGSRPDTIPNKTFGSLIRYQVQDGPRGRTQFRLVMVLLGRSRDGAPHLLDHPRG